MTREFWTLYLPVLLALCAGALMGNYAYAIAQRWYRRRVVRREVAKIVASKIAQAERQRLEAIATARLRRVH